MNSDGVASTARVLSCQVGMVYDRELKGSTLGSLRMGKLFMTRFVETVNCNVWNRSRNFIRRCTDALYASVPERKHSLMAIRCVNA
jgi:hypothetical protein